MDIQCIAVDLDGTLLADSRQISQVTANVINQLIAQGVELIPSTARSITDLPSSLLETNIRYFSLSNGAVIYDRKIDSILYSFTLDTKVAKQLLEKIKEFDKVITIVKEGVIYSAKVISDLLRYTNVKETDIERICKMRKLVENTEELLDDFNTIEKLHLNFYSIEDRDLCLQTIPESVEYSCSSSGLNIEITNPMATKGHSILKICEHLSLDRNKIMAFGDNLNDVPLFEVAHTKVAMKNAKPELKQIADQITEYTNQEDGVAHFLKEYFQL